MRGRKSNYQSMVANNLDKVRKWKEMGATDEQIMSQLGIGKTSYYKYMKEHPEFANSIKTGVDGFVITLKGELAKLATKHTLTTTKTYIKKDLETGKTYENTEITEKEVDAQIGAIHLLLKNLDKDNWKQDWDNYENKKEELKIKKQLAESKEWN